MAINKKRKFINNNDEFEPCQKLKIAKLDLDGFNYRDGFGAFYDAICSDNEIKRKKLRKLLEFLQENRDNVTLCTFTFANHKNFRQCLGHK